MVFESCFLSIRLNR